MRRWAGRGGAGRQCAHLASRAAAAEGSARGGAAEGGSGTLPPVWHRSSPGWHCPLCGTAPDRVLLPLAAVVELLSRSAGVRRPSPSRHRTAMAASAQAPSPSGAAVGAGRAAGARRALPCAGRSAPLFCWPGPARFGSGHPGAVTPARSPRGRLQLEDGAAPCGVSRELSGSPAICGSMRDNQQHLADMATEGKSLTGERLHGDQAGQLSFGQRVRVHRSR